MKTSKQVIKDNDKKDIKFKAGHLLMFSEGEYEGYHVITLMRCTKDIPNDVWDAAKEKASRVLAGAFHDWVVFSTYKFMDELTAAGLVEDVDYTEVHEGRDL